MPPLPAWDSSHPLIIHFPIALLLTAPLFIVLALLWRAAWKPLGLASLVLLMLGAGATALAVASGEAGESAAKAIPAAKVVLERHEELGELTRNVFLALTVAFAGILGTGLAWSSRGRRIFVAGSLLFLVPYAAGALLLVSAAHQGGVLVHEYGVHAAMGGSAIATDRHRHDG
jgi:uncharacterized membrane protein